MTSVIFIILAYLCGSINFAIILCKLAKLPDPRSQGSGNPGATNVLRFGGKKLAVLVILGDSLKGLLPVLFAAIFGVHATALSVVALAAVLGHMYPVFFRFTGGKGVATTLGAILGLSWPVGLAIICTWLLVALISRFSSLASVISVILLPVYTYCWSDRAYLSPMVLMSLIILFQHRKNILRLIQGQEPKISIKG